MTKSEQARADAMADAETLRLLVNGYDCLERLLLVAAETSLPPALWPPQSALSYLHHVARSKARAAFRIAPGLRGHECRIAYGSDCCPICGREDVPYPEAAFRAVPGLRGE